MRLNLEFKKFFLSLGPIGFSKKAPGTMGSFLALVFIIFIKNIFSGQTFIIFFIAILLIFIFYLTAFFFIKTVISEGDFDRPWIIIDEFIGMIISGLPFLVNKNFNGWLLILGFVFFRFFDIFKPSLIKKIDKINSPHGVLLDDVAAGLISAFILMIGIFVL